MGAVIGTLLAETSVTAIQFFFVKKDIHVKVLAKMSALYFVAGILMCMAVTFIGTLMPSSIITFVIQVIVGGMLYIGVLCLFRDDMLKYVLKTVKNKISRKSE